MKLETCTVSHLDVYSNPYNLRRDIHTFTDYVSQRQIKRAHRSNKLPQADTKRLAKLMSHPDCLQQLAEDPDSGSWWLNEVDSLARRLGFISYDTTGVYAGYSSAEPSFPDNLIVYNAKAHAAFLALPLSEQEKTLYAVLCDDPSYSEFFTQHLFSQLSGFPKWGSAIGVIPLLNLPAIRRSLFELLTQIESDQWVTTASLIRYLQEKEPYFLIPPQNKLPTKNQWGRAATLQRYENFREFKLHVYDQPQDPIPDNAPDGFARVEGRFIERFLEGIALTLGYVDVAYDPKPYRGLLPEWGTLLAFRVNGRFQQFMRGEPLTPKVTVLPNFELHVEAPFYPAGLMQTLRPFTTTLTEDHVTILKLDKQQVKTALTTHNSLDIATVLKHLTNQPLPQNVAIELEEWSGQTEVFTLYSNSLALLEGDPQLPEADPFVIEQITPQLRLVRHPNSLFDALEQAERVPLAVRHDDKQLTELPTTVRTIFPKQKEEAPPPKTKTKEQLTVKRETKLTLYAPTDAFYKKLHAALLQQRCVFEANQEQRTLTYSNRYKTHVDDALKTLRREYTLHFEDVNP